MKIISFDTSDWEQESIYYDRNVFKLTSRQCKIVYFMKEHEDDDETHHEFYLYPASISACPQSWFKIFSLAGTYGIADSYVSQPENKNTEPTDFITINAVDTYSMSFPDCWTDKGTFWKMPDHVKRYHIVTYINVQIYEVDTEWTPAPKISDHYFGVPQRLDNFNGTYIIPVIHEYLDTPNTEIPGWKGRERNFPHYPPALPLQMGLNELIVPVKLNDSDTFRRIRPVRAKVYYQLMTGINPGKLLEMKCLSYWFDWAMFFFDVITTVPMVWAAGGWIFTLAKVLLQGAGIKMALKMMFKQGAKEAALWAKREAAYTRSFTTRASNMVQSPLTMSFDDMAVLARESEARIQSEIASRLMAKKAADRAAMIRNTVYKTKYERAPITREFSHISSKPEILSQCRNTWIRKEGVMMHSGRMNNAFIDESTRGLKGARAWGDIGNGKNLALRADSGYANSISQYANLSSWSAEARSGMSAAFKRRPFAEIADPTIEYDILSHSPTTGAKSIIKRTASFAKKTVMREEEVVYKGGLKGYFGMTYKQQVPVNAWEVTGTFMSQSEASGITRMARIAEQGLKGEIYAVMKPLPTGFNKFIETIKAPFNKLGKALFPSKYPGTSQFNKLHYGDSCLNLQKLTPEARAKAATIFSDLRNEISNTERILQKSRVHMALQEQTILQRQTELANIKLEQIIRASGRPWPKGADGAELPRLFPARGAEGNVSAYEASALWGSPEWRAMTETYSNAELKDLSSMMAKTIESSRAELAAIKREESFLLKTIDTQKDMYVTWRSGIDGVMHTPAERRALVEGLNEATGGVTGGFCKSELAGAAAAKKGIAAKVETIKKAITPKAFKGTGYEKTYTTTPYKEIYADALYDSQRHAGRTAYWHKSKDAWWSYMERSSHDRALLEKTNIVIPKEEEALYMAEQKVIRQNAFFRDELKATAKSFEQKIIASREKQAVAKRAAANATRRPEVESRAAKTVTSTAESPQIPYEKPYERFAALEDEEYYAVISREGPWSGYKVTNDYGADVLKSYKTLDASKWAGPAFKQGHKVPAGTDMRYLINTQLKEEGVNKFTLTQLKNTIASRKSGFVPAEFERAMLNCDQAARMSYASGMPMSFHLPGAATEKWVGDRIIVFHKSAMEEFNAMLKCKQFHVPDVRVIYENKKTWAGILDEIAPVTKNLKVPITDPRILKAQEEGGRVVTNLGDIDDKPPVAPGSTLDPYNPGDRWRIDGNVEVPADHRKANMWGAEELWRWMWGQTEPSHIMYAGDFPMELTENQYSYDEADYAE